MHERPPMLYKPNCMNLSTGVWFTQVPKAAFQFHFIFFPRRDNVLSGFHLTSHNYLEAYRVLICVIWEMLLSSENS